MRYINEKTHLYQKHLSDPAELRCHREYGCSHSVFECASEWVPRLSVASVTHLSQGTKMSWSSSWRTASWKGGRKCVLTEKSTKRWWRTAKERLQNMSRTKSANRCVQAQRLWEGDGALLAASLSLDPRIQNSGVAQIYFRWRLSFSWGQFLFIF